jgi:hypothetical protein
MSQTQRCLIALFAATSLSGCASISSFLGGVNTDVTVNVQGTHQPVEVVVEGLANGNKAVYKGHDKVKIKLSKDQDFKLTVVAPGFESEEVVLSRKFNPFTLADLGCCVFSVGAGALQGGAVITRLGSAAAPLAPLGASAGICCGGGVGCCLSGVLYALDSSFGNTQTFDPNVTVKLAPVKQMKSGWVLPLTLVAAHGAVEVELRAYPR